MVLIVLSLVFEVSGSSQSQTDSPKAPPSLAKMKLQGNRHV
jgi:hypothetical protein